MKKEAIAQKNPKSPISETFRILRTNIQFMDTNKKMKSLLVTSTFPGEGKSWVTSNLAITFAQAGKRVILVDADMRKGRQYAIFEVPPKPGLSNYLSKVEIDEYGRINENLNNYIQETEVKNLYIISAGSVPPNPSELLVSTQMINLLEQLKELCDIVIIDGTPCEILTDSVILSRIVDTTIIVTAYKKTKKDLLGRTIKNIQNVGGNIAGVVLNKIPSKVNDQYYYRKTNTKKSKKGILAKFMKDINNKGSRSLKRNNDIETEKKSEFIENINNDMQDKYEKVQNFEDVARESTDEKITEGIKEESNNAKDDTILDEKSTQILQQINEYLEGERKKREK